DKVVLDFQKDGNILVAEPGKSETTMTYKFVGEGNIEIGTPGQRSASPWEARVQVTRDELVLTSLDGQRVERYRRYDLARSTNPPETKMTEENGPTLKGTWNIDGVAYSDKTSVTGRSKITFRDNEAEWDFIPKLFAPGKGALTVDSSKIPPTFELMVDNK